MSAERHCDDKRRKPRHRGRVYHFVVAVWRTKAGLSTRRQTSRASQFGSASTHHSPLECAQRILSARIAASPSASLTPLSFAYSLTVTGRSRPGTQRWSVTMRLKRLSHHCFAWAPSVLGGQLNETERESASGKLSARVALPCGAARCMDCLSRSPAPQLSRSVCLSLSLRWEITNRAGGI